MFAELKWFFDRVSVLRGVVRWGFGGLAIVIVTVVLGFRGRVCALARER